MEEGCSDEGCKTAYIAFSGEINARNAEQIIALSVQLSIQGFDRLYFLFSTTGGSVRSGIEIYNALRALPAQIVFHNIGSVDSIGNTVILAGDRRYACPQASFTFHGLGYDTSGPVRLELKAIQEILASILSEQARLIEVMASRTLMDCDKATEMFQQGKTLDAQSALVLGLVHEIRQLAIPSGSSMFAVVTKS